jgi:hypothetical protein
MAAPQNAITFPCYTIMNKACNGGVVIPVGDGTVMMPLFTSEEAARKFRAAHPETFMAGPSIKFDWDHELLLYLNSLPTAVTVIAMNPAKLGTDVVTYPVASTKEVLFRHLADKNTP